MNYSKKVLFSVWQAAILSAATIAHADENADRIKVETSQLELDFQHQQRLVRSGTGDSASNTNVLIYGRSDAYSLFSGALDSDTTPTIEFEGSGKFNSDNNLANRVSFAANLYWAMGTNKYGLYDRYSNKSLALGMSLQGQAIGDDQNFADNRWEWGPRLFVRRDCRMESWNKDCGSVPALRSKVPGEIAWTAEAGWEPTWSDHKAAEHKTAYGFAEMTIVPESKAPVRETVARVLYAYDYDYANSGDDDYFALEVAPSFFLPGFSGRLSLDFPVGYESFGGGHNVYIAPTLVYQFDTTDTVGSSPFAVSNRFYRRGISYR